MEQNHTVTVILPCNNLDAGEAFYKRIGFTRKGWDNDYRIITDGKGAEIHLQKAVEGWLVPGRNPFGLYLRVENVDQIAAKFGKKAEDEQWGMHEFTISDPDETLIRIGWPTLKS
ncbi:MAG: glyoxalase [Nitrososphaerales archaeon]|jgi:hypothetical protein